MKDRAEERECFHKNHNIRVHGQIVIDGYNAESPNLGKKHRRMLIDDNLTAQECEKQELEKWLEAHQGEDFTPEIHNKVNRLKEIKSRQP